VIICNPQVLSNDAATARIGKQDTIVAYHIPEMNRNTPEKGGCTSTHARTHMRRHIGCAASADDPSPVTGAASVRTRRRPRGFGDGRTLRMHRQEQRKDL
jgi:hypothetical protein